MPSEHEALRQMCGDQLRIDVFAGRVEDQIKAARVSDRPRRHEVVDDPAVSIEQLRISLTPGRQSR